MLTFWQENPFRNKDSPHKEPVMRRFCVFFSMLAKTNYYQSIMVDEILLQFAFYLYVTLNNVHIYFLLSN